MHADVHVCTAAETHLFQLINDLMRGLLLFSRWHKQKHSDKYATKAELHLVWVKMSVKHLSDIGLMHVVEIL